MWRFGTVCSREQLSTGSGASFWISSSMGKGVLLLWTEPPAADAQTFMRLRKPQHMEYKTAQIGLIQFLCLYSFRGILSESPINLLGLVSFSTARLSYLASMSVYQCPQTSGSFHFKLSHSILIILTSCWAWIIIYNVSTCNTSCPTFDLVTLKSI